MLHVLLVAVDSGVSDSLRHTVGPGLAFEETVERPEILERLQRAAAGLDALVVGAGVDEPVRMAQRAQSIDRDLGVVILSPPHRHAQMASAVQCAPFLGSAVSCLATGDVVAIGRSIHDAALQTSRRRSHRVVTARTRERLSSLTSPVPSPPIEFVVYLEQLLDYTPIGVLAVDLEGGILASNRFAQGVLGRSERDLVGAQLVDFFADADRLKRFFARDVGPPERAAAGIFTLLDAGRGVGIVEITATSISERLGRPGIMVVMQDVTDRESARTIRQLNSELERRIAELDAANRELDAFAYSVSHDLRAPLRAIDGFSSALLSDHGASLEPSGQHALQRVRAGAQRMSALIDDLLDLSRISRAPLRKQSIELGELAAGVVAELQRRDPSRQVQVEIAGPLEAMGDGRLMTIVLENLLHNAWKFTARRADAHIALGRVRTGDEMVFFVRDNGAGFDMAYAHRLFTPFQRLHDASEFEGTGIGLATVNRIIARHGGRVWVEAAPGQGAAIFFTLGAAQ
ncbi:MAG TPA: ATP-binding protein [Kofleriaceae bacterium]|nr:ATP-binding protein [Kofleriaceae bacterium]